MAPDLDLGLLAALWVALELLRGQFLGVAVRSLVNFSRTNGSLGIGVFW